MIKILIEFLIFFILCYIIYLFFVILRKKNNKFNVNKPKMEEGFLILKYNIDFSKFSKKEYKKYLNVVALTNSFIFSITLQIVHFINGIFLQILISFIVLVPLILISYTLIGKHYQKKGMNKNV